MVPWSFVNGGLNGVACVQCILCGPLLPIGAQLVPPLKEISQVKVGVVVFTVVSSADVVLIPVIVTVVPDTEMSLLAITVEPFLTRIFALVVGAEESMPSLANIVMFDPLVYATGRFGLLELFHVGADPSGLS